MVCEITPNTFTYEHRNTHQVNIGKNDRDWQMAGPPWQSEFLVALPLTWLQLRGRYTFENLCRQGLFSAVTYRKQFSKDFDFK